MSNASISNYCRGYYYNTISAINYCIKRKNNDNNSKKILIISPIATHPTNSGNKIRIKNMLNMLKKEGFEIHFLFYEHEKKGTNVDFYSMYKQWNYFLYEPKETIKKYIDNQIGKIGLIIKKISPQIYVKVKQNKKNVKQTNIDSRFGNDLTKRIQKISKKRKFDIVLAEYVFMSKALKLLNNETLKIIDTHDIFTQRTQQLNKTKIKNDFFNTTKSQEAKGLNRANTIISIQETETEFFKTITSKNVITIGHLLENITINKPQIHRNKLLFVGNSNNISNIQGLQKFIRNIFPQIQQSISNIELHVVGTVGTEIKTTNNAIKIHGEVNNLEKYYQNSDIIICPIISGTGLKIKLIEGLAYSKPIVATPLCVKGLPISLSKCITTTNINKEFGNQIINLIKNNKLYARKSKQIFKEINKYQKQNIKKLKKAFSS